MSAQGNCVVVIRQVDRAQWCVVVHRSREGRREFVSRVATARPYREAVRAGVQGAARAALPLMIEADGRRIRPFDPARDQDREPRA